MKAQLSLRLSASIIGISLFPLAVGLITAWAVHRSQKDICDSLAINVRSMRASEEVAIGIRDIRMLLDRFLLTGDRNHLDGIPAIQKETDRWLIEAEKTAVVPRELELIGQLKKDYNRFFEEFQEVFKLPSGEELIRRVKELNCDSLDKEVLTPAQEFLDFNEEEIAKNSDDNQKMSDKTMVGLSLLGVCGPLAGLLAGYGIARGINRSIVRLSVPIRDAAGRLNEIAGPINFSAAWSLEDLEEILHKMANQIEAVITRLAERPVLLADRIRDRFLAARHGS